MKKQEVFAEKTEALEMRVSFFKHKSQVQGIKLSPQEIAGLKLHHDMMVNAYARLAKAQKTDWRRDQLIDLGAKMKCLIDEATIEPEMKKIGAEV